MKQEYMQFLQLSKRKRKTENDAFKKKEAFFNKQREDTALKTTEPVALYGLEGLIRREVGNQRPCGPAMRAVQQGLLAGAPPQGSVRSLSLLFFVLHMLSLALAHSSFFGPVGLSGSRGIQTAEGVAAGALQALQRSRNLGGFSDRRTRNHETAVCVLGVCICEYVLLRGRKRRVCLNIKSLRLLNSAASMRRYVCCLCTRMNTSYQHWNIS